MLYRTGLALVIATWLLSGCVSPSNIPPPPAGDAQALWQQHRQKVSGISSWHLRGKIAVYASATNTASKKQTKGGNATLIWAYQLESQEIQLYGPFGSGRVQITEQPGKAILKDTKGNTILGASASEVLYQKLGWRIPFAQLRYWVRGIPAGAGAHDIVLDTRGRLKRMREGDWQVEYHDYAAVGQLQLPRKITLTAAPGNWAIHARDGTYIGDELRVTVLLKRWRAINFD